MTVRYIAIRDGHDPHRKSKLVMNCTGLWLVKSKFRCFLLEPATNHELAQWFCHFIHNSSTMLPSTSITPLLGCKTEVVWGGLLSTFQWEQTTVVQKTEMFMLACGACNSTKHEPAQTASFLVYAHQYISDQYEGLKVAYINIWCSIDCSHTWEEKAVPTAEARVKCTLKCTYCIKQEGSHIWL